jgi:alpha-beta hydrolase superfamily lysophospholipase
LLPADTGALHGLAYTLWLPPAPQPSPRAGIVVVHGADSCKESHHDFARAAVALGLAAVCFDQRGHGESEGRLDGRAVSDVVMFAVHLRMVLGNRAAPIALRGSSMGGYLAILAARPAAAGAVVAICPASADGLRRGLRDGRFSFAADRDGLGSLLDENDLTEAAGALTMPLLLLHAEGDERVPVQHSRELAAAVTSAGSRLIAVPGGHHRSVQHDEELQAVSLGFITRALDVRDGRARHGR